MPNHDRVSEFSVPVTLGARQGETVTGPAATAAALRQTNRELLSRLRSQMRTLRAQHAVFKSLIDSPVVFATESAVDQTWPQYGFTAREVDVARLLSEGRRNTAIAAALGISAHTARHHTQRVLAKLGVHSRAEAGAKLRV